MQTHFWRLTNMAKKNCKPCLMKRISPNWTGSMQNKQEKCLIISLIYTKRDGERMWTDCGWEDAPFDMRRAFIDVDRLSVYEKSDAESLREDAASFDEDEEALAERLNDIADVLDKMSENEILVVFNDVPELTYEVWDRYKVGYHDYDVYQYEIGLKK